MINKNIKFSSFSVIFLRLFSPKENNGKRRKLDIFIYHQKIKKIFSSCFYRVIETLVKVWENSKKLWKHSPAARVPTAFLFLPNLPSC